MITDIMRWVHDAIMWAVIVGIVIGYWVWHSHRYPKVHACRHCDGTGSIRSTSLILGRPVSGPCRWCGGQPWRTRFAAPASADRLTPGSQWRVEDVWDDWDDTETAVNQCGVCGCTTESDGYCLTCELRAGGMPRGLRQ